MVQRELVTSRVDSPRLLHLGTLPSNLNTGVQKQPVTGVLRNHIKFCTEGTYIHAGTMPGALAATRSAKMKREKEKMEKETAGADADVTEADAKNDSGRTAEARTPKKDQDGGKKRNSTKEKNRGRGNRDKPGQKTSETSEGKS